ncbi:Riboflavin synthase [compost metagenome]
MVDTTEESFAVSIIPHTLQETILADKAAGDTVNLEADILGKYIDRLLRAPAPSATPKKAGGLTEAFLAENGFL